MATVALIALAPQIGATAFVTGTSATAGYIAAGTFAALVDSMIVMPRLFPPEDPQGPKYDDLRLQSGSEGSPANVALGEDMRVNGTVVWVSDLRKYNDTDPDANRGKGGGYQVDVDEYVCDVAVAVAVNELEEITSVWADSAPLVTVVQAISFTETDISANESGSPPKLKLNQPAAGLEDSQLATLRPGYDATISGYPRESTFNNSTPATPNRLWVKNNVLDGSTSITFDGNGATVTGNIAWRDSFTITHTGGTTRYHVTSLTNNFSSSQVTVTISPALQENVNADVTVDFEGGNNGTYLVTAAGYESDGRQYAKFLNYWPQETAAGDSITVNQPGVNYHEGRLHNYTVYKGTDYQPVDDLLESWTDDGKVPAARGTAYVVLHRLILTDFGNRLPNFTFKVTKKDNETFSSAAQVLLDRSKMPSDYYDVSNLNTTSYVVPGYNVQGAVSIGSALTPMMIYNNVLARDEDGVLTFYARDSVPSRTIDSDDLGAGQSSQRVDYPISVSDIDEFDIPAEVVVKFLDAANDYQTGTVTERAYGAQGDTTATVDLGMTMDPDDARALAKRMLWGPRVNRQRVNMTLPPSYIGIGENERLTVTAMDHTWTLLTQRVDRGMNGLIDVECIVEEDSALEFEKSIVSDGGGGGAGKLPGVPPARVIVLDVAPLSDSHVDRPGFYFAMTADQPDYWTGGALYVSKDGGTTYKQLASTRRRATSGWATTTLADGPVGYWDEVSTVTVELDHGELESATELAVLNGANRAYLGGEIIAFKTATLVSGRTYTLSGLLRGLRDTAAATSTHTSPEDFVLLDSAIQWQPMDFKDIGTTVSMKAVAQGAFVANVDADEVTLYGRTLRPFAPGNVTVKDEANGDKTITWVQRTRRNVRVLSQWGAPEVDTQTYEVQVLNGSTVVRTLTNSGNSATYTSAQQSTDGTFTAIRVYSISALTGEATPTTARNQYTEVPIS